MSDSCNVRYDMTPSEAAGQRLVDALTERDFPRLAACLAPGASMRTLLPRGHVDFEGADEIVAAFQKWFGGATELEVLDTVVGELGSKVHVAWRMRLHPTPAGDDAWHVIEQQLYLSGGSQIGAIDLLCTGFVPEEATR